jgi:hypothetical protein
VQRALAVICLVRALWTLLSFDPFVEIVDHLFSECPLTLMYEESMITALFETRTLAVWDERVVLLLD